MSEEILKVEVFTSVLQSAPKTIQDNETSLQKATDAANNLLNRINAEGMNDALDADINAYMVKARNTLKLMSERRVPITKLFDDVKKLFTDHEKKLDPKNADSVIAKLQAYRNKYAEEKAKKAQAEEAERKRKAEIATEKVNIVTDYKALLKKEFYAVIDTLKLQMSKTFESSTIDSLPAFEQALAETSDVFTQDDMDIIAKRIIIRTIYVSNEERDLLTNPIKTDFFDAFKTEYAQAIASQKEYYKDRIPSKRAELATIAEAKAKDVEKAAELQRQADERAAAEAQRIKDEAAKNTAAIEASAATDKQVMQVNLEFDNQKETLPLEPVPATPAAKVRTGVEIIVKHPAGYQLIAAKYFEKNLAFETVASLEKKTLGAMKTFCEKLAKDSGEKIETPHLEYKDTYKAVTKK